MRCFRLLPEIKVSDPLIPYMIWSDTRKRYEVYNGYDIKGRLKSEGFRFDGFLKCWFTKDNGRAGREKNIMGASAKKHGYRCE